MKGSTWGACDAPNLVYDVSPDGQRFLMIKESEGFEELRRLVPTD